MTAPTPPITIGATTWQATQAPIRIGSASSSQIVVDDARVAPVHAVLVAAGGRWLLRDIHSAGGTWVDGRRVGELTLTETTRLVLGAPDGVALDATVSPADAMVQAPHASSSPDPPVRPDARRFVGPGPSGRTAQSAAGIGPVPPPAPTRTRPPAPSRTRPPAPTRARPPAREPATRDPSTGLTGRGGPWPAPPRPPVAPGAPATPGPVVTPGAPSGTPGVIRIGRSRENDVIVADLLVSRRHAELRWDGSSWNLLDLGSPNGVFVDGNRVGNCRLELAQRITFGTKSYTVVPQGLEPAGAVATAGAPPVLAARDLTVEVGEGARILNDVSFSIEPGELLAIVGPSGSGKSTLLKALTGSRRPEGGSVEVRGIELYAAYDELCRTIGYVPQDDILHLPLSIRDALMFGAELRFPADTTTDDREQRVDEVLAELELTHRGDVPIERVSGGQRKRTSVALELLTRPELLFLDEPTSGLDPGFERTVTELLRELATGDRAVVVVTHSLQSLELCDKVLFLAPGGHIAFFGKPADALGFFARDDFIDVFRDLEQRPVEEWAARRGVTPGPTPLTPGRAPTAGPAVVPPGQPWKRQVEILARRQLAILRADTQNLMFLAGAVLVPAVLILLLMGADTMKLGQSDDVDPRTILSAVVVAAVAIGTANAIREIVKEMPIYLRERAVGLQRSAYLASKVLVVGALTCVQASVLVIIATLRSGGPGHANLLLIPHLELIVDVMLTGLAAVSLGLLLSTVVSSSEKAMALVPVVFVVQWLFCGVGLDLQSKPVLREVAQLTSANWGVAAAASSIDAHELTKTCGHAEAAGGGGADRYSDPYGFDADGQQSAVEDDADRSAQAGKEEARLDAYGPCDARWRSGIAPWFTSVLALLVLAVVPIWAADRLLARKEPLEAQRVNDWPGPWQTGPKQRV